MLNKPTSNATSGERSFFARVETFIEKYNNEIIGYIEPEIGGFRPDFLLLSPSFGVVVVEIKDYLGDKLEAISKSGEWSYNKNGDIISVKNPFDQVYQYWRTLQDKVNFSRFPEGSNVPVIQLVCFSQISESGRVAKELKRITPQRVNVCFKETVGRNKKFKIFIKSILPTDVNLSPSHFDVLRGNVVPFCRLPTLNHADIREAITVSDPPKLLDRVQEETTLKLGSGHRLIFGVAGSGKTVILVARVKYLAERHPDWKILVLCYNRLLKDAIYQMIIPQDYDADITIKTFHGWLRSCMLNSSMVYAHKYLEAEQRAKISGNMNDFFKNKVPQLMDGLFRSLQEGSIQYDAIFIDEAQDFEKKWFELVMPTLNPRTNALLITCDGVQGIYARKQFYWSDVGIKARGRVKRLSKSYRIPQKVGKITQSVLPNSISKLLDTQDEFIVIKEFGKHQGEVELMLFDNRREEAKSLVNELLTLPPQKIVILFKYNIQKHNYIHPIFDELRARRIQWSSMDKFAKGGNGIYVGTIHSTKGLECNTIVIPEVNTYKSDKDRQLLYVGITRSLHTVILTSNKRTDLIEKMFMSQTKKSNV